MPPKKKPKANDDTDAVLDPDVGADCLFLQGDHAWTPGRVTEWDGKHATCVSIDNTNPEFPWENSQSFGKLLNTQVYMANKDVLGEDVQDLLSLTVLHDSTLLNVLRSRYFRDFIYTNIGAITVALNPFNFKIPWYTDDNMPKYLAEGDRIENNIPHSWAAAHNTYWEMINDNFNQCILVSGESGAGKTEASKIVMKYLAAISCKQGNDEQKQAALNVGTKINVTSAPLESFGNAKTSRNDNSSRFGKWMRVKFDSSGFLIGAHVTKYLLEKSRIVTAQKGERVYHSFYLMCRAQNRGQWGIGDDNAYRNTSAGNMSENKEFNTAEEFEEVWTNLGILGCDDTTREAIWRNVAGVMNLENVDFDADGEGSKISSGTMASVDKALQQWEVQDADLFKRELCTTTFTVKGQTTTKLLNPTKARDSRSALTKTLYDSEFSWIIEKCNESLDVEASGNWIGLLDIFGFEDFEVNSFEQLCINLANESLQNHYNAYIFERDMDECRAEGIDVTSVEFPDNEPCLRMVSGKGGIISLLDDECGLGEGTDQGFLQKVTDYCEGVPAFQPFFTRPRLAQTSFIVHHYAGNVSYEVDGFLDKNRDSLKPAMKLLLRSSTNPFIAELLEAPDEDAKKITVGGYFRNQVHSLIDLINSTNPHWIRCVKPHPNKKPRLFHGVQTMAQLASSGVLGTVKIRKAGFPVRIPFDVFTEKYHIISTQGSDPASIIAASGIDPITAQLGKTRVFLKSESYVTLEKLKKAALTKFGTIVQAHSRAYIAIMALKVQVYQKNKEVVDKLRAEIRESMREEFERNKREAAERAAAEREMMKAIEGALNSIGADADAGGARIRKEEDHEWRRLFEEFETLQFVIEDTIAERVQREEEERLAKIAAEAALVDGAATSIQALFRGYRCRDALVREFTERARSATEFDIDARIFHQHMIMLQLDEQRVALEGDALRVERSRRATEEREAMWREKEQRRAEQLQMVQERKLDTLLLEQRMEEEVTDEALREAHRLRNEDLVQKQLEKRARREENKRRKARVEQLKADAAAARHRRRAEMEQHMALQHHRHDLTEQAFAGMTKKHRVATRRDQQAKDHFEGGRAAYSQREEIVREAFSGLLTAETPLSLLTQTGAHTPEFRGHR